MAAEPDPGVLKPALHSSHPARVGEAAPLKLRCEYLTNPLGIDALKPRLSWVMKEREQNAGRALANSEKTGEALTGMAEGNSEARGRKQIAYQVLVASTPGLLAKDQGDLWDSGKVVSDQSIQVEYAGKPLESRMTCHWKVRVWPDGTTDNGHRTTDNAATGETPAWSEPAIWTMGLLAPNDWHGKWIGRDEVAPASGAALDARTLPARYLRREFPVDKKVVRATATVCGLGFFQLYLNGNKVSDHVMDPALSDYRKAAYYVTFDVTKHLQQGRNTMGVILGNGRFFAPRLKSPAITVDYGYPKLLLQTDISYDDGSSSQIVSDENWKLTTQGPIRANNEYDGETYDARMEMPGWNRCGFDDATWENAKTVAAPTGALLAQMIEPMRVTQTIKPVAISNPKPGTFIIDMGQNFYGTMRVKARAPRGSELRMVSAYSVLPDGMLKTADNRGAKATDSYTFKGDGEEAWSPQFKGQGFRRVQITGFPGTPTPDDFEGLVIHTDTAPVGEFACSNDLINRIHLAARWGMRMFLRSAPLDPDRDERQAWMGDPAKDSESEAYNFDVAAFYTKWLGDVRRSQRPDGTIPDVSINWEWGNGVEWPSVFTIIPDWYMDFYADSRVVKTHYEAMKRWVLTMDALHRDADGTLKSKAYADWCDAYSMDGKSGDCGKTPQRLVSTAYHYHNCRIMARAATRLNLADDAKQFEAMADQLKAAFNKRFFDPATGRYQGGTQCGYILPLAFGMVPPEHHDAVVKNLVDDILVTHQGHLSVGLIGMQWMMQVLTDVGRPDVAWTIATQTTRPSWGYMIGKGATTIWERWDCDTRDPGMNSEALLIQVGGLDAWFYQTLGGINYEPGQPAFKHSIIKPRPLGDLTWVKAHHDSLYGRITSNWKLAGDRLIMDVTIPPNTTATIHVPAKDAAAVTESGKPAATAAGVKFLRVENGAALYDVGSGTYQFCGSHSK